MNELVFKSQKSEKQQARRGRTDSQFIGPEKIKDMKAKKTEKWMLGICLFALVYWMIHFFIFLMS